MKATQTYSGWLLAPDLLRARLNEQARGLLQEQDKLGAAEIEVAGSASRWATR